MKLAIIEGVILLTVFVGWMSVPFLTSDDWTAVGLIVCWTIVCFVGVYGYLRWLDR